MKGKPKKKRTQEAYQNIVDRITKWYRHMEKNRQDTNALGMPKRPLQPLEFFTDKVRKPSKD